MERLITHEIEKLANGGKIVRNYFINDDNTNYLTKAHSYFTKEERKLAKLNHKANLR
ncbi:hypothetical protein [Flagellimonas sp. SN16]|uniref:hypothetical protein n=1 Tax=Flagellimonas sp. SN16 TaxID=3415142 RepID=UPI003C5A1A47